MSTNCALGVERRLALALVGNALQRVAAGATSVLVGLHLAELANQRPGISVALVGTLAAVFFAAELIAAIPLGILADAWRPRGLVTFGALLSAGATQLFGVSGITGVFFLSRAMEGLGAAAVTPPLLAHVTAITRREPVLRAKAMSYFELSLLGGIGFGGLVGAELWARFQTGAFAAVAGIYVLAGGFLFAGTTSRGARLGRGAALQGLVESLRRPSLRRLAPAWLCMNAVVGMWLGPTLSFLLTGAARPGRLLDGVFAAHPERVGWLLLCYVAVFGAGVTAWSFVLPRVSPPRALRITLIAMLAVSAELLLFNHIDSAAARWAIGAAIAVSIMVESGFSPAALALLAGALSGHSERGAAMGIYSALLGIGAIAGSLLAAALGSAFGVDGLIYGTLALALLALASLRYFPLPESLGSSVAQAPVSEMPARKEPDAK